jgi:hypothetical protein
LLNCCADAILLDRAVARKVAPIGNSDSPDVIVIEAHYPFLVTDILL